MITTNAKRLNRTKQETIKAPAGDIFPLACPVAERDWITGWEFDMVFSESGTNENNCLFTETMTGNHFLGPDNDAPTWWYTMKWDTVNREVHFLLTRDEFFARLDIHMEDDGRENTIVNWDLNVTERISHEALGYDETTVEKMDLMLWFLAGSLKHYCETGTKLEL